MVQSLVKNIPLGGRIQQQGENHTYITYFVDVANVRKLPVYTIFFSTPENICLLSCYTL